MKRPSSHARLMALLCLMLLLATGGLVPASNLAGAAPFQAETPRDAYDSVVPGMTRAEDLAGIGLAGLQTVTAAQAAARLHRIDRTIDACLAAQSWCTGYLLRQGGGDAVLLVMDGRVVFKGFAA